jgi:hypothetical protein
VDRPGWVAGWGSWNRLALRFKRPTCHAFAKQHTSILGQPNRLVMETGSVRDRHLGHTGFIQIDTQYEQKILRRGEIALQRAVGGEPLVSVECLETLDPEAVVPKMERARALYSANQFNAAQSAHDMVSYPPLAHHSPALSTTYSLEADRLNGSPEDAGGLDTTIVRASVPQLTASPRPTIRFACTTWPMHAPRKDM